MYSPYKLHSIDVNIEKKVLKIYKNLPHLNIFFRKLQFFKNLFSSISAAVIASQQAAAVTVINPFPPGPNKWDSLNDKNPYLK